MKGIWVGVVAISVLLLSETVLAKPVISAQQSTINQAAGCMACHQNLALVSNATTQKKSHTQKLRIIDSKAR